VSTSLFETGIEFSCIPSFHATWVLSNLHRLCRSSTSEDSQVSHRMPQHSPLDQSYGYRNVHKKLAHQQLCMPGIYPAVGVLQDTVCTCTDVGGTCTDVTFKAAPGCKLSCQP